MRSVGTAPVTKEDSVRRIPALVSSAAFATVLAASLVACSGPSTDVDACTPLFDSGDASSLVKATGDVGSAPKVDFPAPLVSKSPERSVLVDGDGIVATTGMTVDFDASIFDATTGEQLLATKYDGSQGVRYRAGESSATEDAEPGSLSSALVCAQEGQRVAVTSTVLESGLDFSSVGLGDDDTVVFVVDVQAVYPAKADGVNQLPQDGMPNVVTAPDGTPGITLPDGNPPAETKSSTIKAGSGEAIADGDSAVLNLSIWVWPTDGGEISQPYTSWGKTPITQPVSEDPTGQEGVPPGLFDALVGAKVGSQVLIVVAPDDSYAEGAWPAGTQAGDTLVYVIDVLGIQK